ncbi:glia maturation factor beta-like isoform X2 [Gigantopelta aegis]|uniref:glia maturation factor beta-like isoform X1 n=1 Tax=Gigantopelta aegis TaxID=1735272 RepID=UPI001B88883B|nr:glia maturation factor beta-like isoform X1 [Gigantopelta aegis]XP_041351818.1 glia maturation factor beta-like isoform X2 [Gigantopelta aegis]
MAQSLQICSIDPDVKEKLKKFKFRKEKTIAAIILKIDPEKLTVIIDEEYEDCTIDEVQGELSSSQPRYAVISYINTHSDGRVSYPLIFIFCSPLGCKPEFQMMYAGSKLAVVDAAKATKVFDIRNPEDLTEEFIKEKLQFFK